MPKIFQLCWWRKVEYLEKTTNMSQVTDKLSQCIEYTSPWAGFELTTLVPIVATGTDCTGSCKSNYHTITTAPVLWRWSFSQHGSINGQSWLQSWYTSSWIYLCTFIYSINGHCEIDFHLWQDAHAITFFI